MPTPRCWSVVVPVKPLDRAKSRLHELPASLRAELVLAMAVDTVAAAVGCASVAAVYVVTDDPVVGRAVLGLGAVVVPDVPDAGLNPALEYGGTVANQGRPDCGVAALAADLPALTPAGLEAALAEAGRHPRALVSDGRGGSTLLTAGIGLPLKPAFGEGSEGRHIRGGAVALRLTGAEGLQIDVDTAADLAAAAVLGLGARTRAVLASVPDRGAG